MKTLDRLAYTPTEAAEVASVSRPTIYRWMHLEGFPVAHIGGCTSIQAVDQSASGGDRECVTEKKKPAGMLQHPSGQRGKVTGQAAIPMEIIHRNRAAVKEPFPGC